MIEKKNELKPKKDDQKKEPTQVLKKKTLILKSLQPIYLEKSRSYAAVAVTQPRPAPTQL